MLCICTCLLKGTKKLDYFFAFEHVRKHVFSQLTKLQPRGFDHMIISHLQLFVCHRLRPVELPPFELFHGGRRYEDDERHQIRVLQNPQTLRVQIEDADLLGEDDRTDGLERGS